MHYGQRPKGEPENVPIDPVAKLLLRCGYLPQKAAQMTGTGPSDDQIHDQIRAAIVERRLAPGTRLREQQLSDIYAASRRQVRRVLERLAYAGLVEIAPNRGASVAQPSPKYARDLFEARKAIETAVARAALDACDDEGIAMLRGHLALEARAAEAGDRQEALVLSGGFHRRLASLADNAILAKFLNEVVSRESLIIQLYERPSDSGCSSTDHSRIVDALERKDWGDLRTRILDHIDAIRAQVDLDTPPARTGALETVLGLGPRHD